MRDFTIVSPTRQIHATWWKNLNMQNSSSIAWDICTSLLKPELKETWRVTNKVGILPLSLQTSMSSGIGKVMQTDEKIQTCRIQAQLHGIFAQVCWCQSSRKPGETLIKSRISVTKVFCHFTPHLKLAHWRNIPLYCKVWFPCCGWGCLTSCIPIRLSLLLAVFWSWHFVYSYVFSLFLLPVLLSTYDPASGAAKHLTTIDIFLAIVFFQHTCRVGCPSGWWGPGMFI